MNINIHHFPFVLFTCLLTFGLCSARADEAEMVKEKLFQAKKEFDAEVQKFKKAITDQLDKREEDARKAGNKKMVDQVKAERTAFEKAGDPPQMVPSTIRESVTSARSKLDKAYTGAIKEYLRLKLDDSIEAIEKEQQEFRLLSAIQFGKRTYLAALKHFDLKVDNSSSFANDGTWDGKFKFKLNGEPAPHSIFLHPPPRGTSQVKYPLAGKWFAFRVTVGVPKIEDNGENPASALTFELLADGKPLWKSDPVTQLDTFQTCTLKVEKVKVLTLQVHCPDKSDWARAVWFEPILAE
jgi:hypothetical protein